MLLSQPLTEGDNATDTSALVSTTEGAQSPLLMPAMPPSDEIQVDIVATGGPEAWKGPFPSISARIREIGFSLGSCASREILRIVFFGHQHKSFRCFTNFVSSRGY